MWVVRTVAARQKSGMKFLFPFGIAIAIIAATPARSAIPAAPAGPWTVEYAESMCLLSREYGTGDGKATLGFRPGPMSDHMRLVVLKQDLSSRIERGTAVYRFDDRAPAEAPFVSAPVKGKGVRVVAIDVKRDDLAALSSAKQVLIKAGRVEATLAPRGVGAAMKALTACENDLLVAWGMDPAALASIATHPRAKGSGVMSFFSTEDYPSEAIRRDEQGTVGFRILVGVDGRVSDCRIIETSGSKILDQQTCNISLRRFQFEPAKTHDGRAIASLSFSRVRWVLPGY